MMMSSRKCVAITCILPIWIFALNPPAASAQESKEATKDFSVTDGHVLLAPYVWKCSGDGTAARAEASMPGAYLKALVQHTGIVGLRIDGTANAGYPVNAMPIIDYSVDGAEFKSVRLSAKNEIYTVPIASGLDAGKSHSIDIVFRSASLSERWETMKPNLRIVGLRLSPEAVLLPRARLPKNAIAFGDSITEGVNVEGQGPFYVNLLLNNARATWVPIVCSALQAEYGQLGTGGQGMVKPIQIPPLPKTWDRYDPSSSRLTNGLLLPEPDYVFCFMGTNDSKPLKPGPYEKDAFEAINIAPEYTQWLKSVRTACPHATIFCITPPIGLHAAEISAAVTARNDAGDPSVFLIDITSLKDKFIPILFEPHSSMFTFLKEGATQFAVDGVHPSVYGNAMLGALITAEVTSRLRLAHASEPGAESP